MKMNIGERIKSIRGNLTQKEFAKQINADQSTVQNWENKNKLPKGDILQRIQEIFNVNINWLLTGDGDPYLYRSSMNGSPRISESSGLYNKTGGLGQAVDQLAQILTSGNELIVRAILFNLQAFYDTVINQKRDKERIKKLEEESEVLKERITVLEERLDRQTEEMAEFKKAAAGGES